MPKPNVITHKELLLVHPPCRECVHFFPESDMYGRTISNFGHCDHERMGGPHELRQSMDYCSEHSKLRADFDAHLIYHPSIIVPSDRPRVQQPPPPIREEF